MTSRPLYTAILNGNSGEAEKATQQALDAGREPQKLLDEEMIPAMTEIGQKFEEGDCFVPEMLVSARAMKAALAILKPQLVAGAGPGAEKVVIGTVEGDLHDIGKNLVSSMLEGGGFEVIDLGVDVSADMLVDAVRSHGARIMGLSALLTTTMPAMKTVMDRLKEAGLRDQVKVMIGGAPITQQYADSIGADGFSNNANGAVRLAHQMLSVNA